MKIICVMLKYNDIEEYDVKYDTIVFRNSWQGIFIQNRFIFLLEVYLQTSVLKCIITWMISNILMYKLMYYLVVEKSNEKQNRYLWIILSCLFMICKEDMWRYRLKIQVLNSGPVDVNDCIERNLKLGFWKRYGVFIIAEFFVVLME